MKYESAHVILINNNSFLLTQRRDVLLWVIPGGHVEKNENPKMAAKREIMEELGIEIDTPSLEKIAVYKYKTLDKIDNIYKYNLESRTNIHPEKNEIKNIQWVDIKCLPSPMTIFEKQMLLDFTKYKGNAIDKIVYINKRKELANQLKDPLQFIILILHLIKTRLMGSCFRI